MIDNEYDEDIEIDESQIEYPISLMAIDIQTNMIVYLESKRSYDRK